MNAATNEYLKKKFSGYYKKAFFEVPSSLEQREWGFILFDSPDASRMKRHIAFSSREEVENYIKSMVPRHAYYSTAYYALPSAGNMQDKLWSGADLIFDLDADHIVRCAYDEMLVRVHEETQKMISMLTEELGFSRRDMHIVFSGGRGYHIHIRNLEVLNWSSAERREIVDYVCGTGLDPEIMLKGRKNSGKLTGWPGRYREALSEYLSGLKKLGPDDGSKKVASLKGVSSQSAQEFYGSVDALLKRLKKPEKNILVSRVLKTILAGEDSDFYKEIKKRAALTDEPVTTDVKRLIRMPGSLHGGSGFKVMSLSFKEFEDFDPLVDAVVFGDESVKIDLAFKLEMPLKGKKYSLEKGINKVPEALAVFLCARGIAEYAGGE
ncbi:DNA primase small subunit [Methanomicrobium sp. W14]|jgi:DNA primase small subunit|uniref:DNA primase small subunit domain-containing protein n=1 Tax=Methanomicrobium sp. W14 TaxID=2817839 RepID=UPI001AE80D6C|nr:DNA primase small subunit PriS [Methanomicrobium sp. W14]MBP2132770.1 DNA primase small subunit [Methanomicrobium sp. W14]